ncbi:MAG: leucine-rich repeat protein [Ruminococcus sp.]|nr:leucine-rich repeat protein [Ruminococcus sp.]
MRSSKKCLSVVLSILMIFSCFALGDFSVFAAEVTENGVTYSCDGKTKTAMVISYKCQSSLDEVVIPETVEDYTVTTIGTRAFAGLDIASVTLPSSVNAIGSFAFDACKELEQITAGDEILRIGNAAFRDCTKLTSFNFGTALEAIGDGAFKGSGLTSVVIPDCCSSIGSAAFSLCKSLVSAELPESLEVISSNLFYKSRALESIVIPDNVTIIKDDAFNYCNSLKSVKMSDNVEVIELRAFHDCLALEELYISKSLKTISENLFWNCSSLEEVELPESLETIDFQGFRGCEKLKNITIPYGTKTIVSRAFTNCFGLESVVIPETVTEIGDLAFLNCDALSTIYGVKDSEAHKHAIANDLNFIGYMVDADGLAVITCYECPGVTDVIIPDSVAGIKIKGIGAEAFRGNKEIKSVTLSSDVSYIGDYAFEGCSALESFCFDTDSTHIGKYAFANCEGIKTICLPMNVATIDEGAFGYVSSGDEFVPCGGFAVYSGNNSAVQDYCLNNAVGFRFGLLKELETGKIVMGVNYTEKSYKDGDAYRLVNVLGDVNGDLVVNVKDATLIQKYCASLAQINEADMYLADTTLDGAVNVRDATQIQKYIASIIDSFYK